MKKRFIAIVSFILSLITVLSVSGCKIITTDKERDNNQVVATVSISKDAPKDKILKNEMTIAYMNYGYYYVYSGQSTVSDIFDIIIDNLVNTRIMIQNAISEVDEDPNFETKNAGYDKWDVKRYLTIEDKELDENGNIKNEDTFVLSEASNALYETLVLINDLIESYEKAEDPNLQDTVTAPVRTAPTSAEVDTTVSDVEKFNYIKKGIEKGEIGSARLEAYNKFVKELERAGLLGDEFDGADLTTSQYFKENEKIRLENIFIEKYQKGIQKSIRESVTFNDLLDRYKEMYNAQVGKFENEKDFSSAISSAYAQSPIVYSPYSGYGYVYNLLLGADEVQLAIIEGLKGNSENFKKQRKDILASTVAVDQRGSWITSGYDYDESLNTFTGDYTLVKDAVNSLAYKGTVEILKAKTDKEAGEYRVDPTVYNLEGFVEMMDTYLFGSVQTNDADVNSDINWYRKVTLPANSADEYDAKIGELLFAYSTDAGSLNTYKGYVITPNPSESGSETFVEEFAKAGRELLKMGGNSYMIVATKFGYHVMFYSQALGIDVNYDTLVAYLNATNGLNEDITYWQGKYNEILANWDDFDDADNYLYLMQNLYSSTLVENSIKEKEASIVNKYRHDTDYVVIYESRFADLKKA
ncbi:MAG: hypothetical protein J6Q32_03435 [Clostridia bacterium]|nr:hypothetical protein [Clostridia bacterium]